MDIQKIIQSLSVFEIIITTFFLISVVFQLAYYLIMFIRLALFKDNSSNTSAIIPVSVVISAHNEDYNLIANLPSILTQDYPDFEVIVVNHASTDDSREILEDFERKYSNLSIVNIDQDLNFFKGKKFPLSIGIKSAKNEIILLTDADCKAASNRWIAEMASNYSSDTEVVLGYGPYTNESGFLNKLIRYDTFMIAMQYFSFALMGMPYMGVGRNLSYRKSTFFKNKGFISHYNISSGDDDLFIQEVASGKNTKIEISKNSMMYSTAKPTFATWVTQKQRHFTTGNSYKAQYKILLSVFSFTQVAFYLTAILMMFNSTLWLPSIILISITMLTRVLVQKKIASKLNENQLLLFSLIGDFVYVLIMPIITIFSLFRKTKHWK